MCSLLSRNIFVAGRLLRKCSQAYTCQVIDINRFNSKKQYTTNNKSTEVYNNEIQEDSDKHNLPAAVKPEYQVFRDEDSETIFDVDEEKKRMDLETINAMETSTDPYEGVNMKHGVNGVFDIEELVQILRNDKAQNIFVASVPNELSYVDYIVVVTGKTQRHMTALATFIRKVYKLKKYPEETIPKIEGAQSRDWMALDLGNIALHIFSTDAREEYDLETLWTLGSKYDDITSKQSIQNTFADRYNDYLEGLQPADVPNPISKPV